MLRRIALVMLFATLLLVGGGGAAGAGGAVFEIVDQDGDRVVRGEGFVQPGQVVTAHTSFSPRIGGLGGIDDGPYVAYLLPGSKYVGPGSVPPKAIALGELEIVQGRFSSVARITFTVPTVATGEYTMSLCNDPCTVDGLGDIVGGWLRIAQTTKEGRLVSRLEDVKRDRAGLNHALLAADERAQDLTSRVQEAARTNQGLRGEVVQLEAELRSTDPVPPGARPMIESWAAALVALALLALTAFVIRSRSGRPGPPGQNGRGSGGRSLREPESIEVTTPRAYSER